MYLASLIMDINTVEPRYKGHHRGPLHRGVSVTEGLCVTRFIDYQYYVCMYAHDGMA